MTIRDNIKNLSDCINSIILILKRDDTFEELEESANILLAMTGKSEIRDARYSITKIIDTLISHIKFIEDEKSQELLTKIDYLREADIVDVYKTLKEKRDQVGAFLLIKNKIILTSEKDHKIFITDFNNFKKGYMGTYVKEHDLRNSLIANFCKDFENNILFKLLEEIKIINEKFVIKSPESIGDLITDYRREACGYREEYVFRFLEKEPTCTCDYMLTGTEQVKEVVKVKQNDVFSQIQNECFTSLRTLNSTLNSQVIKFKELLKEKHLTRNGDKLLKELEKVLKKPDHATQTELKSILNLLKKLEDVLKQTFKVVRAPKPPTYIRLSDILRKFKEESRKERVTIMELFKWIKEKFGEEEEILIDIS